MMLWRTLINTSRRLMSTNTNAKANALQSHLEKISGSESHKLSIVAKDIIKLQRDFVEIDSMRKEASDDQELQMLAEKDMTSLREQIEALTGKFMVDLVDSHRADAIYNNCEEVMVEISAGVGGQEAMLFTKELSEMYEKYARFKRWNFQIMHADQSEMGGLRHSSLLLSHPSAYRALSLESGVHRVQRVPKTEKSGRIHTSTSTVSITPSLQDVEIKIEEKDLKIEAKKASGAGGMHVNTTESAVRMTHLPTGLVVDCQMERSQIQNRTLALKMLKNKLYKLEVEKQVRASQDLKKKQVGMGERSDKIRTYNYLQDRVTDHRFSYSVFNIRGILDGGEELEEFFKEIKRREVDLFISLLLD